MHGMKQHPTGVSRPPAEGCRMRAQVLKDGRLPKEVRKLRAQGLRELGGLFLDAAAARQEVVPATQDNQVRVPH